MAGLTVAVLLLVVMNVVMTAGLAVLLVLFRAKGAPKEVQAALDLCHKVASDAMLHLKSQTAVEAAQAVTARSIGDISVQEQRFLAERTNREILAEESRQENTKPVLIKDEDGLEHNLNDYIIAG